MVVSSTANGFRAAVSALRSLDGGEGVSFHILTLPEDRCLKNPGRGMPEGVLREELEALNIHVQAIMQLRSGRRDHDPTKDRPLTPHFIVSVAREPEMSKVRSHRTLRSASVGGVVRGSKEPVAMQALPALRTHAT